MSILVKNQIRKENRLTKNSQAVEAITSNYFLRACSARYRITDPATAALSESIRPRMGSATR
jgi:hypothetical protein